MEIVEWMLVGVGVYLLLGVVFAIVFVARGMGRIDEAARGAGVGVRLLLIPGSAAVWPWMLGKWLRAGRGGGA